MKIKVAKKDHLLALVREADKSERNRRLDHNKLFDQLDPDGWNMCYRTLLHNDQEIRGFWFLKVKGQELPVDATLDMSFEMYNTLPDYDSETKEVTVPA